MAFLKQTGWLLWKDLVLELRRRESLLAMFFFGTLLLFIFNFALDLEAEKAAVMAPGLLWLAVVFCGTLGLMQLFQPERENRCLEALLLAPVDRAAIFLSKVFFNLVLMVLLEAVVFPLFWLLFNVAAWDRLPLMFLHALLGTVGFCVVGTLFSALTLGARGREILLPLLLLPLLVPVVLATIRGMEIILRAGDFSESLPWLHLLIGFDVIFSTAGILVFEWVIES
ncbi:MAG TPA: heme exporter protein CcmB [Candidatus Binatia bacterium]|jgi:heme exporter protein B